MCITIYLQFLLFPLLLLTKKKGATGHYFFSFLQKKHFFKKWIIPTPKQNVGKKKNYGHPTGHNYGHPLDRKQTFFMDSLLLFGVNVIVDVVSSFSLHLFVKPFDLYYQSIHIKVLEIWW